MGDEKQSMRVLMLPWLAHGHISPFLELAKKLTHRNFHIYLCSSPINLSSIKKKVDDDDSNYSNSIELVEFHVRPFPELPPQCHTTKGLPPHLLPILMKALNMSRPNFSHIVETLKPDLIINDFLPTWVPDVASSMNIPTVSLMTSGASFLTLSLHLVRNKGEELIFPFPKIYSHSIKEKLIQNFERLKSDNDGKGLQFFKRSCNIVLIKSFPELEGKYMDYLSASFGKKIVPVGPLVPHPDDNDKNEGMNIIKWLDNKEKSSTVFVSFGSECYPSKEDMEEIANGLELSKVNFIWVVRFPKGEKMKLEDALPIGFLEMVREKGLVVEDWAPQVKILAHANIGGFVSHCGWGSSMESIRFGVPIIAMPMRLDQPVNAKLAEVSRIGMEVKRDNNGKLQREIVAQVINEVVVEKNGEEIRRRTKEMKDNIEKKVDQEMDEVVKELLLLCEM